MSTSDSFPFLNVRLPLEERARDLISRLTLEEKISLIPAKQSAVKRLEIPEFRACVHDMLGPVTRVGAATVFPEPLGLSCTWNTELLQTIGDIAGSEARADYKKRNRQGGLMIRVPVAGLAHAEDPHLTGRLATAYIKGVQGDHPHYLKAVASVNMNCTGNNNSRYRREYYMRALEPQVQECGVRMITSDCGSMKSAPEIFLTFVRDLMKNGWKMDGYSVCDDAEMLHTYANGMDYRTYADAAALAIKSGMDCITGEPGLVMGAIREALERGLLEEADLDRALFNVFSIRFRLGQFDPEEHNPYEQIPETIFYHKEHRELALRAARESIVLLKNEHDMLPLSKEKLRKAAVIGPLADIVCCGWYQSSPPYLITPLQGIIGKLSVNNVMFHDGCDRVMLQSAALQKYVGMKGDYGGSLAAYMSDNGDLFKMIDWGGGSCTLQSLANGNYVSANDRMLFASAREDRGGDERALLDIAAQDDGTVILKTWNGSIISADELSLLASEDPMTGSARKFVMKTVIDGIAEAANVASMCEVAIVIVGIHPLVNAKGTSDRHVTLPPHQEKLIHEVYNANPNTVVVIVGSSSLFMDRVQDNIPAIVYTDYGGQESGNALADVLFGDYNPAGRLSKTWYRTADAPAKSMTDPMDNDMINGKQTYMYFDGKPLYPFGHGLSYTCFQCKDLKVSKLRMSADEQLSVKVTVENIGSYAGDEVVQLYIRANESKVKRPFKELRGFKRLHLPPGGRQTVEFVLSGSDFAYWDAGLNRYVVETGIYSLFVRSSAEVHMESAVQINGETDLTAR